MMASNQPAVVSNLVVQTTGTSVTVPDANDPVEKEFQQIMSDDNAAQAEVDKWIEENQQFAVQGGGTSDAELNQRIRARFDSVEKAYQDFIRRNPNHVRARIAYASFLGDIHNEEDAMAQLEKALALDTNNPAIYNNLANINGHIGDVKKSFDYYAKAIQLNPREPVYYHNFGTTVYLFRKDAREYFSLTEDQVFDKALGLYSNAMRLDPQNFPLASDVAQSYYGIKPLRPEAALQAWTNALNIAHDETEREGVYLHFARVHIMTGHFPEAHAEIGTVTNEMYSDLKKRLLRNLEDKEKEAKQNSTNDVAKAASKDAPKEPAKEPDKDKKD